MQENEPEWFQKATAKLKLFYLILYHHRKRKVHIISGIFKIFTRLPTPPQGQKAPRCTTRGSRFGGIPGHGIRPTKNVLNYNDCFFWLGKEFDSRTKFSKDTRGAPNLDKIHKRPIKSCSWWTRLSMRLHYVDLTKVPSKAGRLEPMRFYEVGSHSWIDIHWSVITPKIIWPGARRHFEMVLRVFRTRLVLEEAAHWPQISDPAL